MKIMPSADRQREDQRTYSRRKTCKPSTRKESRLNLLLITSCRLPCWQ